MRGRHLIGALIAALAAATLPGALGATVTTPVSCGDVVMHSIVVGNDLAGCTGNGLVAGASGITINLNGHTIAGDNSGGGQGVLVDTKTGVTVEHGTVTQFENGVLVTFGSHDKVVDVTAKADANDGFGLSSTNSTVQSSYSLGDGGNAFEATAGSISFSKDVARAPTADAFLVQGSLDTVDSSLIFNQNGIGIDAPSGTGVKITNNRVAYTQGDGIVVGGTGGTISGNEIGSANALGIDVTSSALSIMKNTIVSSGDTGIDLASASGTTISQNVVGHTGTGDGIDVGGGSGVKILNNTVTDAAAAGISSLASGAVVTGNVVGHTTTGGGIVVQSVDPVTIMGNTVQRVGGNGIDLTAGSPSTISGNTVEQAAGEGILVTASATKVTKNTIDSAETNGIHVASTTNGDTIQGNLAELAITGAGILVEGSNHSILQNVARVNQHDGIQDSSTGSTVKQNVAVGNDFGIVTSGTDGGGNKAAGNATTNCTGVACTAP